MDWLVVPKMSVSLSFRCVAFVSQGEASGGEIAPRRGEVGMGGWESSAARGRVVVDAFDPVAGDFELGADVFDLEVVRGESSAVRDESSASDFEVLADHDELEAAHFESEMIGGRFVADRFDLVVALFQLALDQGRLVTTHDSFEMDGGKVAAGKCEIATAHGDVAAVGYRFAPDISGVEASGRRFEERGRRSASSVRDL